MDEILSTSFWNWVQSKPIVNKVTQRLPTTLGIKSIFLIRINRSLASAYLSNLNHYHSPSETQLKPPALPRTPFLWNNAWLTPSSLQVPAQIPSLSRGLLWLPCLFLFYVLTLLYFSSKHHHCHKLHDMFLSLQIYYLSPPLITCEILRTGVWSVSVQPWVTMPLNESK